jgi:hypothetical protein
MVHHIRLKRTSRSIYAIALALAAVVATTPAGHAADSFRGAASAAKPDMARAPALSSRPTRVAEKRVYLGRAPYVCTPSGYGEKAHCVLRARIEATR